MSNAHGSEIQESPDWWVASDGRWYPPELHPDYQTPAAPAPPAPAPPAPAPPAAAAPPASAGLGSAGSADTGIAETGIAETGSASAARDTVGGATRSTLDAAGDAVGEKMPSVPEMPSMPDKPSMPEVPSMPDKPSVPEMPSMPDKPSMPEMPPMPSASMSSAPAMPAAPTTPAVPDAMRETVLQSSPPGAPSTAPPAAPSYSQPAPTPTPPAPGAIPAYQGPSYQEPAYQSLSAEAHAGAAQKLKSSVAGLVAAIAGIAAVAGSLLQWGTGSVESASGLEKATIEVAGLDSNGLLTAICGGALVVLAILFFTGIPKQLWWAILAFVAGGAIVGAVVFSMIDIADLSDRYAADWQTNNLAAVGDTVTTKSALGLFVAGAGGVLGVLAAPFVNRN